MNLREFCVLENICCGTYHCSVLNNKYYTKITNRFERRCFIFLRYLRYSVFHFKLSTSIKIAKGCIKGVIWLSQSIFIIQSFLGLLWLLIVCFLYPFWVHPSTYRNRCVWVGPAGINAHCDVATIYTWQGHHCIAIKTDSDTTWLVYWLFLNVFLYSSFVEFKYVVHRIIRCYSTHLVLRPAIWGRILLRRDHY